MNQRLKNHISNHAHYTQIPSCFHNGEEFLQDTPCHLTERMFCQIRPWRNNKRQIHVDRQEFLEARQMKEEYSSSPLSMLR